MKSQSSFLSILSLSLASVSGLLFGAVAQASETIEIPVEVLLAPTYGYEVKNNVQVVLYGVLPNACYSLSTYDIETDLNGKTVRVHQYAQRDTSGLCAESSNLPPHMQARVPFTSEVSVGHLTEGDFTFQYKKPEGTVATRKLHIAPNVTMTVDTIPYAAISSASIPDLIEENSDLVVTLQGTLNSTCVSLDDDVKVMKESDVFVLLPTIKVKKGSICLEVITPFEKQVNLGKHAPGRYLVHTRSMNGRAVNGIFEVVK